MREDVVVVTVEYRVGLLGFLSDETKTLPGNLGMLDIQLALGWVQQVISDFGGNPDPGCEDSKAGATGGKYFLTI